MNIFKDNSAALNWMIEPKTLLENQSPASLLSTKPNLIKSYL
ncbi:antitoxin Xre/MbcA/ParS toxin-binding domain-containing protein [Pseudoalteromonas rhizosphaerae]|uniref:Antitoxin Xre/MbcA/ParS toxin-binding domain-containing protein n=1 Tax=Pseudoalteromonas rhizosphaerae TaxID=2518973 RepID=A0ABW8L694_9GAMM